MSDPTQKAALVSPEDLPCHVLDHLAEGCQVVDTEFRYRYVNDAVVAHGRTTREALLGRTMMECYPGIEDTPMFELLRECMAGGGPRSMENEFVYPDGSRAWFELRMQSIDGGVVLLSVDVTDRKRRELDLARSEALRRAVYVHLPNPTWVWRDSPDGFELLDANRAALDSVGAREWNVGAPPGETLPGLPMLDEMLRECVDLDEPLLLETEAVLDEARGARMLVVRCGPAPPDMAIVHVADVTEQRRAEEQLAATHRLESLGRLAGGVAHDFNNLLSVIIGCAEMGLESIDEDHELRVDLEQIHAASGQATALISQLLTFGRRQAWRPERLTLGQLVESNVSLLHTLVGGSLEFEVVGDPGQPVSADPSQLVQALVNLVVNARDAMPDGGRLTVATGDVTVGEQSTGLHAGIPPGEYAFLSVSDTGTGMDDRTLDQVFEPFFTTKPVGSGTGLGLSTVYGIVSRNRGWIRVESELGRGTTFAIFLEHARGAVAAPPEPVREESGDVAGRGEHVLVVDDNPRVRDMAARILRSAGYVVSTAPHGRAALELLAERSGEIDAVLSDIVMPEMGGVELAEVTRVEHPDVPVTFMSGYTSGVLPGDQRLAVGVNLVRKPFTAHALRGSVARALRRRSK